MATYGYCRVSSADQVRGTSLEEQERKVRAIAEFHGKRIANVFVDSGVSGGVPLEERPEGKKLTKMLKPGDMLICAKLDRLFRDAADALVKAKQWRGSKIKLIVADMGADPVTENGVGNFMLAVLAAVAEMERERIMERVNEGRRAKERKGGFIGGSPPFGYRVQGQGKDAILVKDPDTYPALKTIYRCADQGMSLRKTSEFVAEKHGASVSYQAIRRILLDRERERTETMAGKGD